MKKATKYPNLAGPVLELEENCGDDVQFEEDCKTAGISLDDILLMEASAAKYVGTLLKEGVPFPGDDEVYDALVKDDKGLQLIQKYHDFWS